MLFKNKDFKAVIEQTNLIKADDYESKYIFLRGMSLLSLEDTATAKQELQKIIDLKKDLLQSNEA